jgi:hypothetical protein
VIAAVRVAAVVVVADVACPSCSQIARELPDLLRVPVTVRSCRDPRLATGHPTLPATVLACRKPAIGVVRSDGSVRWWPGLTGALGVRPRALREALVVLWTAMRVRRR